MAMITRSASTALFLFTLLTLVAMPARASLFSLAVSGTITENSSGDSTIPIGTPWTFELTYDTAAPDLDFELTGSPDPTFGRFTNTSAPPALIFFHYQAGGYEVTIDDPADFGLFSVIDITFTSVNAIDINIHAPTFIPPLAGGPVSFHADFNAFSSAPIFSSDALPTNTALGATSFDQSTVTLLPHAGVVSSGSLTSLTLTAVPDQCNTPSADADGDHDVDLDDFGVFQRCYGAGNLGSSGVCHCMDLDRTGASANRIDNSDFIVFKACAGGAGLPSTCP
jgi:hypothetical protein